MPCLMPCFTSFPWDRIWIASIQRHARALHGAQKMAIWDLEAQQRLNEFVQSELVLVQISAAKRLRDRAEREAKEAGQDRVTAEHVEQARDALRQGALA